MIWNEARCCEYYVKMKLNVKSDSETTEMAEIKKTLEGSGANKNFKHFCVFLGNLILVQSIPQGQR